MSYLVHAQKLASWGLSPIPVLSDGSKQPYSAVLPLVEGKPTWKPFQTRIATDSELQSFFTNGAAVAIACGVASGNLEIIDFDEPGIFEKWRAEIPSELYSRLILSQTPSGCYHIWYRLEEEPQGNKVLARNQRNETAIETRGQGGYALCAPSQGYKFLKGKLGSIPVLTLDERSVLFDAAYALHAGKVKEYAPDRQNPAMARPGDAYGQKHTWAELLMERGWVECGHDSERVYWRRPGKPMGGQSASTHGELGTLHVFTSNAYPLEPEGSYSKFAFYALMNHGGDYYIAAQTLSKQGYSSRKGDTEQGITPALRQAIAEENKRTWFTFNTIQTKEVDWLWKPYIPIGLITLIYGDADRGKSTAALAVATAVTLGYGLPFMQKCDPGNVLILSAEDPPDTVILPRLQYLGANLERIMAPNEFGADGASNPMVLDETGAEELYERAMDFNTKLIIVDPVVAYLEAAKNMNATVDVREWMRRLGQIAHRAKCGLTIVHHVNKDAKGAVQYRAMGSGDFYNASRSALMIVQDPDDTTRHALTHVKHNLSAKAQAIGYSFDDSGQFRWDGYSDLTPESCAIQPEVKVSPKQRDECKAWILELLSDGRPVPSKDIFEGARQCGFAGITVKRAKSELPNVKARKVGDAWEWKIDTENAYVYRGGD